MLKLINKDFYIVSNTEIRTALQADKLLCEANLLSIEKFALIQLEESQRSENIEKTARFKKIKLDISRKMNIYLEEEALHIEENKLKDLEPSTFIEGEGIDNEKEIENIIRTAPSVGMNSWIRYVYVKSVKTLVQDNIYDLDKDLESIIALRGFRLALWDFIRCDLLTNNFRNLNIEAIAKRVITLMHFYTVLAKETDESKEETRNFKKETEDLKNKLIEELNEIANNLVLYKNDSSELDENDINKFKNLVGKTITLIGTIFIDSNGLTTSRRKLQKRKIEDELYDKYGAYKNHYKDLLKDLNKEYKDNYDNDNPDAERIRRQIEYKIVKYNQLNEYFSGQQAMREKQYYEENLFKKLEKDLKNTEEWKKVGPSIAAAANEKFQKYAGYNLGLLLSGANPKSKLSGLDIAETLFDLALPLVSLIPGGQFFSTFVKSFGSGIFAGLRPPKPTIQQVMNKKLDEIQTKLEEISKQIDKLVTDFLTKLNQEKKAEEFTKIYSLLKITTNYLDFFVKNAESNIKDNEINHAINFIGNYEKNILENLFFIMFGQDNTLDSVLKKMDKDKGATLTILPSSYLGFLKSNHDNSPDSKKYNIIKLLGDLNNLRDMTLTIVRSANMTINQLLLFFSIRSARENSREQAFDYWSIVYNRMAIINERSNDNATYQERLVKMAKSIPELAIGKVSYHTLRSIISEKNTFYLTNQKEGETVEFNFFYGPSLQVGKLTLNNGIEFNKYKFYLEKNNNQKSFKIYTGVFSKSGYNYLYNTPPSIKSGFQKMLFSSDTKFEINGGEQNFREFYIKLSDKDGVFYIFFNDKDQKRNFLGNVNQCVTNKTDATSKLLIIPNNLNYSSKIERYDEQNIPYRYAYFAPGTTIREGIRYLSTNGKFAMYVDSETKKLLVEKTENGSLEKMVFAPKLTKNQTFYEYHFNIKGIEFNYFNREDEEIHSINFLKPKYPLSNNLIPFLELLENDTNSCDLKINDQREPVVLSEGKAYHIISKNYYKENDMKVIHYHELGELYEQDDFVLEKIGSQRNNVPDFYFEKVYGKNDVYYIFFKQKSFNFKTYLSEDKNALGLNTSGSKNNLSIQWKIIYSNSTYYTIENMRTKQKISYNEGKYKWIKLEKDNVKNDKFLWAIKPV